MRTFFWQRGFVQITSQGDVWLDRLAVLVFLVGLLLLPSIFNPWGFDRLQLPKQAILFLLTGALGLLWILRCFMRREVIFPWDAPTKILALLGVTLGISAASSADRMTSFFGVGSQIGQAWTTWLCFFALFCLGRVFFVRQRRFGLLLGGIIGSGFLVSALSLFRSNLNPIGSPYDLAVYLLPIAVLILACGSQNIPQLFFTNLFLRRALWGLMIVSLVFFLEIFVLVDFALVWIGLGVCSLVLLAVWRKNKAGSSRLGWAMLVGVLVMSVFMGVRHLPGSVSTLVPVDTSAFLRRALHIELPSEIIPNTSTSWHVSREAWKEHPLFGSGQGTWSYAYDRFHDLALNTSPFWKTRFPHASSLFLTLFSTLGLVNMFLFLVFGVWLLWRGWKEYFRPGISEYKRQVMFSLALPLLLLLVLFFFRFFEVSSLFLAWSLLTLLATLFPWRSTSDLPQIYLRSQMGLFLILMLLSFPRIVADAAYARGSFTSAHRWNPWQDTYLRAVSQLAFQEGRQMINLQEDPTRLAQGVERIRESLRLSQQASQLNLASADHWLDQAAAYGVLSRFETGLDEKALVSLQEAEKRQPLNPQIPYQTAKVLLARGEGEQKWIESKDERAKQEAQERQQAAFRAARERLNRALLLKSDFTPARYELAALEEREGHRKEAMRGLEQVLKDDTLNLRVMAELGLLYAQDEQFELSAKMLEQFIQHQPNAPIAHWYLALVYERLGRIEDAMVQLRLLLSQSPNDEQAQQRLQLLQRAKATSLVPAPILVTATTTSPSSSLRKRVPNQKKHR